MNHDAIRALLLSVACFEYQFDRPPTTEEVVQMRGPDARRLLHKLSGTSLINSTSGVGWSALEAQGLRTY